MPVKEVKEIAFPRHPLWRENALEDVQTPEKAIPHPPVKTETNDAAKIRVSEWLLRNKRVRRKQ